MSKERILIANINGTEIYAVNQEGETYVPIRPICTAIGINYTTQVDRIQSDSILSTTVPLRGMVAEDGKEREMICLPLRYVYGWLFSINPDRVKPEARDKVIEYKRKCYDALYDYFTGAAKKQSEMNEEEKLALQNLEKAISVERMAKEARKVAEVRVADIRKRRFEDTYPTLF